MPQRFVSSTRSYSSRSVSVTDLQQPDAGVVAQDVDPPEPLDGRPDEPLRVTFVADVRGDERELVVPSPRAIARASSPSADTALRRDHGGTLGGETLDDRPTDSASGTGDDRDLAVETAAVLERSLVISDDMLDVRPGYNTEELTTASHPDMWRGVYPAICTPFTIEDAVDLEAQRRVVRFALDCGSHGIVAFGLAGEVLKLSADERRALTDVILDEVGGAVPVFVGAGAPSIRASVELARHAEQAGASCVVLPAPMSGSARRGCARRLLRPRRVVGRRCPS